MKKIIFLLLFLPVFVFGQSTGKIMSNRSSNATLPVDTINCNSKINLNQTTTSVTLTVPNKTASACAPLNSGTTLFLSNTGSVSVTITVSGSSSFLLAINSQAILSWIGIKWTVIYTGSGGGGSFLPLAGGTVLDSAGNKSFSSVARSLYNTGSAVTLDYQMRQLIYGWSTNADFSLSSNNLIDVTKVIGNSSGDNIWFTPSSGMQINCYSDLYLSGFNSTHINGQVINIQGDNELNISGSNTSQFVRLNTSALSVLRTVNFPNKNGTFAYLDDITGLYLPLTLGANTTIAMGSRTLDFTRSGNIVFRPSNGTFYDLTTVQSADMINRLLYDNIGAPVFTWANASTAGVGITRVGNNTYIAYLKNSNLTADKTYQFPNANTTFVGDDATQTLTNKTISGSSNTLSNIGNSSLSNSTISGVSLGSNLNALTLGTYLSGSSYNGSTGVTVNVSTMTSTVGGAVPTPPNNTTTFLRGDGTFATPPSSSGTVSTVSVTSTNGFAGTVANATTTPAITISTTVTGLLKGNGTSMSAATAGTDYAIPTTIAADATDADYTAVINSVKYLPSATLTTNRTITIPTGSNGDFLEIYNNEAGFSWLLSGASVYLSDGTTIVTSLYANTNHLIRKVSGKWRILN